MVDPPAGDRIPVADLAVRITLSEAEAEVLGAVLMDRLGPFEQQEPQGESGPAAPAGPRGEPTVVLVFYPPPGTVVSRTELLESLPPGLVTPDLVDVEVREVPRDWVDGWRDHFRPVVVGAVRVHPPWIPALEGAAGEVEPPAGRPLADVVIDPGLGFGTGLHPTTRGALRLLQRGEQGALVDAGTGSGVLAIAAAKLGWAPVVAFDNDPIALKVAQENVVANDVDGLVGLYEADVDGASLDWFAGATVVANMTLEPVCWLLRRPAAEGGSRPARFVVSGVMAGAQEATLLGAAGEAGLRPRRRVYEAEWVSVELVPAGGAG